MATDGPVIKSGRPQSTTVYFTRAALEMAYAENAALLKWLQATATKPTYLFFQKTAANSHLWTTAERICSKLRATYGQKGARFFALSSKPGRICVCAYLSSETTKSPSPSPSPTGPSSTYESPLLSGQDSPPPRGE